MNNGEFEYNKFHFLPVRNINDIERKEGVAHIRSDRELAMAVYTFSWVKWPWDYNEFYRASGGSKADLFLCVESGRLYIPGSNELFEWIGRCV